jgi:3-oxoacyl-[acyl-carrier protein] reductase
MQNLQAKRAAITGAASGIGRAIAIAIELAKADIGRAIDSMLASWPEIDVLVNNAGVAYRGNSAEMMQADWERLLVINLLAPIQICQRLLPVLLCRPEAHVVNVSSMLGLCGFPKFSAYSASKFGLVGYTESLRMEHIRSQIGVSAVCPGFVLTPFIDSVPTAGGGRRQKPPPRWFCTTAETVAKKTVKAIRRDRGVVVVTPLAQLTWRLKRFIPAVFELPKLLWDRRHDPSKDEAEIRRANELAGWTSSATDSQSNHQSTAASDRSDVAKVA